jgi:3'(2'), 5'-bisphosphate nucleotidase
MSNSQILKILLENYEAKLLEIAKQAGEIIMQMRNQDLAIERKSDNSQVTKADIAADLFICQQLADFAPNIHIVSEEGTQHPQNESFWCVDPLDGTKSYIRGDDDFTVNISLIMHGLPVVGVIYIPAMQQLYYGEVGGSAYSIKANIQQKLQVRAQPNDGATLILSRYHSAEKLTELKAQFNMKDYLIASSSLKFCRVAEGVADIYPRFGATMEWDTAAGHAILKAAGGKVVELDNLGSELRYGKPNFLNPNFVAYGGG